MAKPQLVTEGSTSKVTRYKCEDPDCGAKDSDRGVNGTAPAVLVCWKCKKHHMLPVAIGGAE